MPISRSYSAFGALILLGAVVAAPLIARADTRPQRVVSINLCTDQLAMLVAGKDQLLSVSFLATDPRSSAMAKDAQAYVPNHGLAEEIYLMQPDLVIAGRFSTRATTDMLRRLGIPVAVFDLASDLDDVRARLLQMGDVLGRQKHAAQLADAFDADLAALLANSATRPSAALYSANGYTSGDQTLAGQILVAAGFDNIATEAGFPSGGKMPLEVLAMAHPDAVISSRPNPGASRSEDILEHPVVQSLRQSVQAGSFQDRDWVCGTPFVLRAIAQTAALRRDMQEGLQ